MTFATGLALFGCALAICLAATPAVAHMARWLALTDAPDGRRKLQPRAVPLGGGLAITLSVACSLTVTLVAAGLPIGHDWIPFVRGFLPAAAVLLVVGLVDDFIGVTGIYKLLGQFVAASLLAVGGVRFDSISLIGPEIQLGDFSIPFAIFFCLGAINAFNLIDGADALASSVGAVVCFTVGLLAASQGGIAASALAFAMSGALVGFLRYNAPPAKIYLGDTGSMLIGLAVAYTSIACSIKHSAAIAIAVPVALCALPILDASAALIRRVLTGQSIFDADRGHFHHSLLLRGFTVGQTAAIAAGLTCVTSCGALAAYFMGQESVAALVVLVVFAALAAFRLFGHAELHLMFNQSGRRVRSLLERVGKKASESVADTSVRLQGQREWALVWQAVCEAAPRFDVWSLRLTVNIPGLHESFYASWTAPGAKFRDRSSAWKVAVPLRHAGDRVGKLEAQGFMDSADLEGPYASLHAFLEVLELMDAQVAVVLGGEDSVLVERELVEA